MGFPFRSRLEHEPDGEVTVVQMKDIDEGTRMHIEGALRRSASAFGEQHYLRPGDLVFRSRGRTNLAVLVPKEIQSAVLAAPMILIRPKKDVLPEYLHWYINLPAVQILLSGMAEGTSVRMVSKAALAAFEVPVPDLSAQERIVTIAALEAEAQRLAFLIAEEKKRLADELLLRYAKETRRKPG